MAIPSKNLDIFEKLQSEELDMVSNYAASLIRNRVPHTKAYNDFMSARKRMLKKNTMTDEEIDAVIHEGSNK